MKHMKFEKKMGGYIVALDDGPIVSGHKPSVDVMFDSIAEQAASITVATILTGMGRDGAKGLLNLRDAGARTLGEHEDTCIVYGMPRKAFEIGAIEKMVRLPAMAEAILNICNSRK